MRRLVDPQHNRLAILAIGAVLLLLIALVDSPNGWLEFLCLLPLVLAAGLLGAWYLAAAGTLGLVLSEVFNWIPWIPPPATVLFVVSVLLLLQVQSLRDSLRRKEAQLHKQEEWHTFFENSPAAILTADGEGRIVLANPAAQKLFGFGNLPLRGQPLVSSFPALATALRIEREKPLFHTLTECKGWRPNGEMFVADAWFSINNAESGTRLGAVIVDASERLQERERWGLRSAMATSQIAIGAVLHEIRNLSAAAAVMHNNLERLTRLQRNDDFVALGNLLRALAKIASAELRPGEGSHRSVDLRGVLGQLRIIIDPWFRESEMCVNWDIAPDLPPVWGEEPGLLQIFLNLAQNSNKAMHSSEQKQLTISAGAEGDAVMVRFRDTGPGVADPEGLFRPFHRSTGVKGLGLYVSRAIAHSFSGELKYVPLPAGSCFAVELVPLREWQKVTGGYESATAAYHNSSC
jgi:two-component system, LuxR family, sensor kinase FixL